MVMGGEGKTRVNTALGLTWVNGYEVDRCHRRDLAWLNVKI